MHNLLFIAAAEHEASPGILQALGIDGKLLIEQTLAFLILVALLSKFVYPALIKAVDARREQVEASSREAKEAEAAAEAAQENISKMLADARKEADDVVARAQQSAQAAAAEAETRAQERAERIVVEAREQLSRDVDKARAALRKDTVELVALATEKVTKEKVTAAKDQQLIESVLAESRL